MTNLEVARQMLEEGYTCAAYDGKAVFSSRKRGVAPLLAWLEEGRDFSGFSFADKVVGRGAAFLYLLLKVRQLHAQVISCPALELLQNAGTAVSYDCCVPAIRNRDQTGFCPIETTVLDCTDPNVALVKIKKKLLELQG